MIDKSEDVDSDNHDASVAELGDAQDRLVGDDRSSIYSRMTNGSHDGDGLILTKAMAMRHNEFVGSAMRGCRDYYSDTNTDVGTASTLVGNDENTEGEVRQYGKVPCGDSEEITTPSHFPDPAVEDFIATKLKRRNAWHHTEHHTKPLQQSKRPNQSKRVRCRNGGKKTIGLVIEVCMHHLRVPLMRKY
jgi:hypothetical protein